MSAAREAVVVGAGPNGLAASITLARAGHRVRLLEASDQVGGGCRSAELTLPGFTHDICSAIHPLAVASPFFRDLPLARYGLEWIEPPVALAHPFDDGTAAALHRSLDETVALLGADGDAWRDLMQPLIDNYESLLDLFLGPLRLPRRPLRAARFGMAALRPATGLARARFRTEPARALFAGLAAHSLLPLDHTVTAGFGLVLGLLGHTTGWPFPRGGAQQLSDALARYFLDLGGTIETGRRIERIEEIESDGPILFDLTPKQVLTIAGERFSSLYARQLRRYRYGVGVFKVDWALDGPVPWRADVCRGAGTVHLGGTLGEIETAERAVVRGEHPERPFVLLAQPSRFDPTRVPAGQETLWAYCHVPNGSTVDMTERIEAQIERFAPGFRERILVRTTMGPAALEAYNANYIGGDINGGVQDIRQFFTRPAIRRDPYSTPDRNIFICSSSTPPGGGVHGMSGYHAAKRVINGRTATSSEDRDSRSTSRRGDSRSAPPG